MMREILHEAFVASLLLLAIPAGAFLAAVFRGIRAEIRERRWRSNAGAEN